MMTYSRIGLLVTILFFIANTASAQLQRQLVQQVRQLEQTFMAPRNINVLTVHNLAQGELHYSIMHTFGYVNSGYQSLWGIDDGANIRLSFEYGLTDKLSVGFGRSSFDKIVDFTARYHVLSQLSDDSMPVSVSFSGGFGMNTSEYAYLENLGQNGYSISDRLNIYSSLLIARKFTDRFSLQLSPGFVHFNRVGIQVRIEDPNQSTYFTLGVSSRYKVSPRGAVTFQFIPALSGQRDNHNFAIGYDIETGGHVFQLFLSTSQALNDSYLIASENGSISEREFRFGFNINRLFSIR
jgi:hypothetical protein